MEKMSSAFLFKVLQLLGLNSDLRRQQVGCLQTEAAAAAAGGVSILARYLPRWLSVQQCRTFSS